MRSNLPRHQHQHDDDGDLVRRVQLRVDHQAEPGDPVRSLATLLRALRDRSRKAAAARAMPAPRPPAGGG
jgi:hypothetical protein